MMEVSVVLPVRWMHLFRAATVRERSNEFRAATAGLCVPARRPVRERTALARVRSEFP